jgi:hypothetical protein
LPIDITGNATLTLARSCSFRSRICAGSKILHHFGEKAEFLRILLEQWHEAIFFAMAMVVAMPYDGIENAAGTGGQHGRRASRSEPHGPSLKVQCI